MRIIDSAIVQKMVEMIAGHATDYEHEMRAAYQKFDSELSISFAVKFYPGKGGAVGIDVGMTMVTDKVKVRSSALVDQNQRKLLSIMEEG